MTKRFAKVWGLVLVLAPRELKVRYRQSIIAAVWSVINPVVLLAVYGTLLTQSFGVTGSGVPYLSSAWVGLTVWTFFAASLAGSVSSILSSADLITKVYFPRESIPLAVVCASLVDLAVAIVVLAIVMTAQGITLTSQAIVAVVPFAMVIVWTSAVSILVAMLAAFIRDVVHAVHLLLRIGFIATPIVYDVSYLPDSMRWLMDLNPIAVAITALRSTLLFAEPPDWPLLLAHTAAGVVLLFAAIAYTKSVEARLVDVV